MTHLAPVETVLAEERLPEALWRVLEQLRDANAPLTYSDLAKSTGLARATVAAHARDAGKRGWARLNRDGREAQAEITLGGRRALGVYGSNPTVKAVIAYARQLCIEGAKQITADPYARPYVPSDATARKLSQQLGPVKAIEELRRRAVAKHHEHRQEEEVSERAELRLERRHRQHLDERSKTRAKLTPGQRLDQALAELQLVQAAPAGRWESEPIKDGGGSKDTAAQIGPRGFGDPTALATRIADRAVQSIEHELDKARRRLHDFERDEAAA